MTHLQAPRLLAASLTAVLALALAGCQSGMTYGTGKSPAAQTMEDLAGIAALGGPQKPVIDYQPRPKPVAPPDAAIAQLPPPGDAQAAALPADWPVDPDQQRARMKMDIAAREAAGLPLPKIKLSPEQLRQPDTGVPNLLRDPFEAATKPTTAEQSAKAKKLFADARGALAVDENGLPVRRYLSDPPSDYRAPDPTAPVEIIPKAKKKFKWWWQQ